MIATSDGRVKDINRVWAPSPDERGSAQPNATGGMDHDASRLPEKPSALFSITNLISARAIRRPSARRCIVSSPVRELIGEMTTRFVAVGFPLYGPDDIDQFIQETWSRGAFTDTGDGYIIQWAAGNGAELWAQAAHDGHIMGLDPHYSGNTRLRVRLMRHVQQPGDSHLEGCFYCWVNPRDDEPEGGQYPFVFRAPEFGMYRTFALPVIREVQVAAIARRLDAFPDDDAFYASQNTIGARFAAESFIPFGLFQTETDEAPPFRPQAIFAGHILDTSLLTNPATGLHFYWARVRTSGGEIDVVVDPEVLSGILIPGGVANGSFWLSGRIIEPSEDRVLDIAR